MKPPVSLIKGSIYAHDDDGGVLVRVLPFPHDLPVVGRRFLSRNTSLWRADSRRRRFASSSGDRGVRGLGAMVLDSEIDWELVELEAGCICSIRRWDVLRGSKISNLGILGDERGTTQLLLFL